MFHSGDSALQAPCEGGGTLWFHKILALSSTLVRTLGFQPGKFGSTPNRATNGGKGYFPQSLHRMFLTRLVQFQSPPLKILRV